jgi:P4 family phage/plasmid primase-like protien
MAANTASANLKIVKKLLSTPEKFRATDFKDKANFSQGYTKYGSFDNWGAAMKVLNNLPQNENIFNELILSPAKVKPYLDVEWFKDEFPDLDNFKVKEDLKKLLIEVFLEDFKYELSTRDIYFSSCHRPKNDRYKYSYHVIISTHPTVVFFNSNEAAYLANKLREVCSKLFSPEIIDRSVYSKTQNMRLINHCKVDEFVPFEPENGVNIMEYIITNVEVNHIILKSCEQKDNLFKNIKNIKKNSDIITPESLEEIKIKVKALHPSCDTGQEDGAGFVQFNYSDRSEPCFCHEDSVVLHDQIGFFVYIYNNLILAGCHSGNCVDSNNKKIIKIIGNIAPAKNLTFEKVHFDNTFEIDPTIISECVSNSAMGISNLFQRMYLSPKRIKWINDVKNGISYFWDGLKWQEDDYSFIERLLVTTVVRVLRKYVDDCRNQDLEATYNEENIELAKKIVCKLNDGMMIQNIVRFIKPLIRDTEFSKIKDIHPHFLSVKNGMIDLFSGELRHAVPEDNITRTIDTAYDPQADSSDFDNFVREITSDENGANIEMYEYLRWCIGYACQGNPKKKMFMILYGPHGFNGKSLLLNTISDILMHYAVAMDSSVVLEGPKKSAGAHSTELCQLENCRFGILSDTKENCALDDGQLKMLTGITDKLSVREIFGKQKEFSPVFVPFISTNHPISINLSDKAMYERLVLFPFVLSFVDEPKKSYERKGDNSLAEKFRKNKKGVLKWLVEASMYYNGDQNKMVPECIKAAKNVYNKEVNAYMDFIDNYFVIDPTCVIKKADMMEIYKNYARENSIKFVSKVAERELDRLVSSKKVNSRKVYYGIKYKDDLDEVLDDLA